MQIKLGGNLGENINIPESVRPRLYLKVKNNILKKPTIRVCNYAHFWVRYLVKSTRNLNIRTVSSVRLCVSYGYDYIVVRRDIINFI